MLAEGQFRLRQFQGGRHQARFVLQGALAGEPRLRPALLPGEGHTEQVVGVGPPRLQRRAAAQRGDRFGRPAGHHGALAAPVGQIRFGLSGGIGGQGLQRRLQLRERSAVIELLQRRQLTGPVHRATIRRATLPDLAL